MRALLTFLLRARPAAAACALALAAPAFATIYKCDGPGGAPVYQDAPCPPGKELRDFDKDPPTVSVMPLLPPPAAGTTTRDSSPAASGSGKPASSGKAKAASTKGSAAERKFIAPGIYEGEVMARLGTPDMKSGGGARKQAKWTYLPAPEDPSTVTTLTFENGRLVEVERKVVK